MSLAAQNDCPGIHTPLAPAGYEQITISTTALSLTIPNTRVKMAVVLVEAQPLRYRDDGTAPTAAIGTLIQANESFSICGSALARFQAIRSGATDAVLNVNYYE